MKYAIYMLRFTTPVHFGAAELGGKLEQAGSEFSSDSLFSAICWELQNIGETDLASSFCQRVQEGQIRLSDMLPYQIEEQSGDYHFYLPKPLYLVSALPVHPAASLQDARDQSTLRKKMKKMKYLRSSEMKPCLEANAKGEPFVSSLSLGEQSLVEKVNCRGDEPLPYYMSVFTFAPHTGGYVIVQSDDDTVFDWIQQVLSLLGQSGIGGKRSAGYGKFSLVGPYIPVQYQCEYEDVVILHALLADTQSPLQMNISSVLPTDEELDLVSKGQYALRRRSGFYSGPGQVKKRNSVYMIRSGSCFAKRLEGQSIQLEQDIVPTLWRNGKGLFVGLPV